MLGRLHMNHRTAAQRRMRVALTSSCALVAALMVGGCDDACLAVQTEEKSTLGTASYTLPEGGSLAFDFGAAPWLQGVPGTSSYLPLVVDHTLLLSVTMP